MKRSHLTALLLAAVLVAPVTGARGTAAPAPRTITILAGDDMKFSVAQIKATRGERLRIVLKSSGTMPKMAMAHNVVVLATGTDAQAFANASVMARASNYVPAGLAKQVVAATGLAGNGETVEVTFAAPAVPGRYEYICSFPGHFLAGMRGVLIVR